MQKDISIEEVKKYTTQKEETLQKMKRNIQALQINMAKKKRIGKPNPNNNQLQPLKSEFIHQKQESDQSIKSPINYQSGEREFVYNSTLFKNMHNQSQPIMQNGSAVSNFSSVSNINNILNNNHQNQQRAAFSASIPRQSDNLLQNIDKVLQRVQNSRKMPNKTLERIVENKNQRFNSSVASNESFSVSNINNKNLSARTKIQEYKKMIKNLDEVTQEKAIKNPSFTKSVMKDNQLQNDSFAFIQNNYSKTMQAEPSELQLQMQYNLHKKDKISSLSYQSDYPMSQSYKLPPTPPTRPKLPQNAIERQKAKIKESFQQYKKMEIQHSQQILDKSEIDFQLSDEQASQPKNDKSSKKGQLQKQKEELQLQLKAIQQQLRRLQEEL